MKTIRLAVLLLAVVFLNGCTVALVGIGAGLGAGTYRYIQGSVEKDYALPYATVWDAVNTALANHYMSVTDSSNEGFRGRIEAVRRDGKKANIQLQDKMQGLVSVSVRIGIVGIRTDAEKLHEEIRDVAGLN
jgi:hypothetical protein